VTDDSPSLELDPAAPTASRTKLKLYKVVDGIPTFRDSELVHVFQKAKEERLLPLVMYNVDPETPAAAFVRMYRIGGGRMLWLVFDEGELAGWVWLDDFANRTARSHFCLFRWVSQARRSEEIGREMFRHLFMMRFHNERRLQVIRAEMPAFNKPGLWFLQSVGMKVVGEIPDAAYRFATDKFCPMVYLYATRDMVQDGGPASPLTFR
jgi:hypothetical protein